MTMRYIQVKLLNAGQTTTPFATGWNVANVTPTSNQTLFANMIDSTGASTGISAAITSPFSSRSGSSSWTGTGPYHGFHEEFYRSSYISTSGTSAAITHANFAPGQTGTITISGHALKNRNTQYKINDGTGYTYTATNSTTPNAPIVIPFTADGSGNVKLSQHILNITAYMNGYVIAYDPDTAATITSIDPVLSGQSGNLTISNTSYAANSLALSDGVVTKNVALTGSAGNFTFTGPAVADGQTMLRTGNVSAVATDGTNPTTGTTTTFTVRSGHPDDATLRNFSSVTLTTVSDPDTMGVALSLDPLPAIGWDVIYDASRGWNVTTGGVLTNTDSFTGNSQFYLRDLVGTCHFLQIETIDGTIVSVTGGLTVSGLTVSGLTVRGL